MLPTKALLAATALVSLATITACDPVRPWTVKGAPDVPPDEAYRTGTERGVNTYIWNCYQNERVVVQQYTSATLGAQKPVFSRGACGAHLPAEADDDKSRAAGYFHPEPLDDWPGWKPRRPTPAESNAH